MFALTFDTSNPHLSLALLRDNEIIAEFIHQERDRHCELLVSKIADLLKQKNIWYDDLSFIASTLGPGSFTGTRIALTCARTINLALNIPLILPNSLEVVAHQVQKNQVSPANLAICLDAGLNEIFFATYHVQNNKISTPQLVRVSEITQHDLPSDVIICGNAKTAVKSHFDQLGISSQLYDASNDIVNANSIAQLSLIKYANKEFSHQNDPLYLREASVSKPANK